MYISDIIFSVVLFKINIDELTHLPQKAPTKDTIASMGDSPTMTVALQDDLTQLTEPTVIADHAGNIILWYIPNGMNSLNQVGMGPDSVSKLE